MAPVAVNSRAEGRTVPIHDWTGVDAGLFHAFHQGWIIVLSNELNAGILPPDYADEEAAGKASIAEACSLDLCPRCLGFFAYRCVEKIQGGCAR
jgi:hypothetical protein